MRKSKGGKGKSQIRDLDLDNSTFQQRALTRTKVRTLTLVVSTTVSLLTLVVWLSVILVLVEHPVKHLSTGRVRGGGRDVEMGRRRA